MSKVRIIQSGVGGHGWAWVSGATAEHPDAELVAVADVNPEALARAGERAKVPADRRFDSLEKAVAAVEADAVLSVTPPKLHEPQAMIALEHGLHFLVEKPLSDDLAAGKRMVAAAEKAGRQLMVSQNRRWDDGPHSLRHVMLERPLGALGHGHVDFYLPADFTGTFRQTMPHVLLVDMCVHHVDLIRYVTGRDITRIYATDFNPSWSWYERDAALKMILHLDDGTVFSYSGDWSAHGTKSNGHGNWRLQCAQGSIHFGTEHEGITLVTSEVGWDANWQTRVVPLEQLGRSSLSLALNAFCQSIRTGEPAMTSGRDNLNTLGAIFAAVRSCETGQVVDVAAVLAEV